VRADRYYTGETLFDFGFGLSYTSFALRWSPAPPPARTLLQVHPGAALPSAVYSVVVTNTGKVAGDEVVLAYTKAGATALEKKRLFDFQRVRLAPGASATLQFTLGAADLALVDPETGHTELRGRGGGGGEEQAGQGDFEVVFSRGHGEELAAAVSVRLPEGEASRRLKTFRKFW
jgi:hypothetical protein